jgi:hypothetical protein
MAQAASVLFLNPGSPTETFWVSYAQFMQAAAKDHGLDLRVRYCERNAWIDSPQAQQLQASTWPGDFRALSAVGKPASCRYPFSLRLLLRQTPARCSTSLTMPNKVKANTAVKSTPRMTKWLGLPWLKSRARFLPLCTPKAAAMTLWSICQKVGGLLLAGSFIKPSCAWLSSRA